MKRAKICNVILKVLTGIIAFVLLFTGCVKPADKNHQEKYGLFKNKIDINGIIRRYAIYIPENQGKTGFPVIFELHGGGVSVEDMTGESGYKSPYKLWMDLADSERFIVVYPEGLNGAYNKPTWNDCRADCIVNSDADDVTFLEVLLDHISGKYNVDQNRIYVSGTSNGGFMALRLAVELSGKIAAVAAVAASMPAHSKCHPPQNPVSVLFMNGTDDNHMPYNGGYIGNPPNSDRGSAMPTKDAVNFWVHFDHTDTVPDAYLFPDLDTTDGGRVEKFVYKNGMRGTEVVLYRVNGGGHSAPSIREQYSKRYEQYFNRQNHDIEMTTEVWKFFKDKTRKHSPPDRE